MSLKVRISQQWPTDLGPSHSSYWLSVDAELTASDDDYVTVSIAEESVAFLVKKHKLVAGPERVSEIANLGTTYRIYSAA